MKLQFVALLILGPLAWSPVCADSPKGPSGFPTPEGLVACASGDKVAGAIARVAAELGGEFLGCFQSERAVEVSSTAKTALVPVEYAFAIALKGEGHTPADLDKMLSTVKEQWKDFDPLSKEFKEAYTARLNEMIKSSGLTPSPSLKSLKPVLISIDRPEVNYYSVTSIRTYSFQLSGDEIKLTKINSDAVVLRRSQLIRLTIQRTLSDPADVAQVQDEIAKWARETAQDSLPARP